MTHGSASLHSNPLTKAKQNHQHPLLLRVFSVFRGECLFRLQIDLRAHAQL